MFNLSQVTRFAARLAATPSLGVEDGWKDEWAEKIADEMRDIVPVDTGELRDSIAVVDGSVQVLAGHGVYVEYGTSDTPPQPYVNPAIDRLASRAADDLGVRIVRLI